MTTLARVDEALSRFNRKSPRDAYRQVCEEMGVHYQKEVYNRLPEVPSAWHRVTSLDLENVLLGTKGCLALIPCILVSTSLRKVCLRDCGVSDEFVKELCETLQSHKTVRSVDISYNDLVTVYSASSIISLMKNNSNMVGFEIEGTHIGDNVGKIIVSLGELNQKRVAGYFVDQYFKLKDMFGYLDEDGKGWVLLKSLAMNCPYPSVQEQFSERISKIKPKKRSDNKIDLNTFMTLVYVNYKTESEINEFADQKMDVPYVFMVANWKQILSAVNRYNDQAEDDRTPTVVLPQDLHRLRVKDFLFTNEEADKIIQYAIRQKEREHDQEIQEGGATSTESPSQILLTSLDLIRAFRNSFTHPQMRPIYQFFEERDPAYIPEAIRNGSRVFSVNSLPMSPSASLSGEVPLDQLCEEVNHTWSLPSSIVKQVVTFFKEEFQKIPVKKQSVIPDSPRTVKDKAMEKKGIPIETVLNATFGSGFESICPSLLKDYYKRYGLPWEDSTITLQELVNVLDEFYVVLTVDKEISLEQMEEFENPLKTAAYSNLLSQHLLERDEDTAIVVSLRHSVSY